MTFASSEAAEILEPSVQLSELRELCEGLVVHFLELCADVWIAAADIVLFTGVRLRYRRALCPWVCHRRSGLGFVFYSLEFLPGFIPFLRSSILRRYHAAYIVNVAHVEVVAYPLVADSTT